MRYRIATAALILAITAMPVFGQSGAGWLYPHEPGYVQRMFPAPNTDYGRYTTGTVGGRDVYLYTTEDGYTSGTIGDDSVNIYERQLDMERPLWGVEGSD